MNDYLEWTDIMIYIGLIGVIGCFGWTDVKFLMVNINDVKNCISNGELWFKMKII